MSTAPKNAPPANAAEEKAKALQAALAQIEKQFGKGAIMRLGEGEKAEDIQVVSRSVSNVKVLRGVDSTLDKEAVRVVSSSPKWKPGKQRDRTIKVIYTFPVIFQLR